MAKVKIGVFGGHRGRDFIREIVGNNEAELVAVCDRAPHMIDRARAAAEAGGADKVTYYNNFEDFFNHDMDAVVLANPAHEHVPYAIRLLDSGRHILSECLLSATMKQAVELIEAVERSGKIYSYAENYCYTPARWEMRERYKRG
ncbi:MAG: hypothetical protein E7638_05635, partial [Ruminococcaceae bacterium]|nr:hypothetical protein [Oscillospiraceae bacterium]